MKLASIAGVTCQSADLDRTVAFYEGLGFRLAKQVPGLDTPAFESCVTAGTNKGLVQQNLADFNTLHLSATPTVLLDGKQLTLPRALYKASPDGKNVAGSDPATFKRILQEAGLP